MERTDQAIDQPTVDDFSPVLGRGIWIELEEPKPLPVSLAVSTRLPASPVDLASVVNIDNKDDENIVLDIGDYPIVTDPVAPET